MKPRKLPAGYSARTGLPSAPIQPTQLSSSSKEKTQARRGPDLEGKKHKREEDTSKVSKSESPTPKRKLQKPLAKCGAGLQAKKRTTGADQSKSSNFRSPPQVHKGQKPTRGRVDPKAMKRTAGRAEKEKTCRAGPLPLDSHLDSELCVMCKEDKPNGKCRKCTSCKARYHHMCSTLDEEGCLCDNCFIAKERSGPVPGCHEKRNTEAAAFRAAAAGKWQLLMQTGRPTPKGAKTK